MKAFAIVIALVAVIVSPNVAAAPFGIAEGTPIKVLIVRGKFGKTSFVVLPPKPNSNFDEYVATATPVHGVCAVTGRTQKFATFREAVEKQKSIAKLLAIYGKPRTVRVTSRTPILEMTLAYSPLEWRGKLPYRLSSVTLDAIKEADAYFVEVSYFYKNMAGCANWEPRQDRKGL